MTTVNTLEDVVQLLDDLAASSALSKRYTDDVKAGKEVLKKIVGKASGPVIIKAPAYQYDLHTLAKGHGIDSIINAFSPSSPLEVVGVVPPFSDTGGSSVIYRSNFNRAGENKLAKAAFSGIVQVRDYMINNPTATALSFSWDKATLMGLFNLKIK